MRIKGKTKRVISCFLAMLTVASTVVQPMVTYAAEPSDTSVPYYRDVKDQLDADEVVTAYDYTMYVGDSFDVKTDFTGIEIPVDEKVKVKFQQAMNDDGEEFSTDHEDTYEAVYYVEPQMTDHPMYQISRKLVVKERESQAESTVNTDGSSDHDSGSGETEEMSGDEDADSDQYMEAEQPAEESETEITTEVNTDDETDISDEEGTILTDDEFDAEIEASEDQETVDPETGITLSEVLEEAVEQDVDLEELEIGETVTFAMPMLLAASDTGSQNVSITRGSWYHYADYGLGSYITAPYYVSWGGITATAYCVQPSKTGPDDGTYTITKLGDNKTLAKVCYYGTKASDENGFFDEKHPDFSTGKRFIITHIAAAYANGSSDWASGTNSTGQSLAMELYNYCVNMPEIPDVDMSFSKDDVKAYVEGNSQRTETITFKADTLQTITFKLPSGVKLVNVSTGKTSIYYSAVTITVENDL